MGINHNMYKYNRKNKKEMRDTDSFKKRRHRQRQKCNRELKN